MCGAVLCMYCVFLSIKYSFGDINVNLKDMEHWTFDNNDNRTNSYIIEVMLFLARIIC